MKAINLQLVLEGLTSKKDRSLSLRFSTPELSSTEKATLMDLQGQVLESLLQPSDEEFPDIQEVKNEVDRKTPSARLRGILWVLWDKRGRQGDFNSWYTQNMEKFIQKIKDLVDEEDR